MDLLSTPFATWAHILGDKQFHADAHRKGFFSGLPSKDPHAHIAKLISMCNSCVGRTDFDMNVIRFRVFPLSLIEYAAI